MTPSVTNAAPTGVPLPGCRSGKATASRTPSNLAVTYNWRSASSCIQQFGDAKRRTRASVMVVIVFLSSRPSGMMRVVPEVGIAPTSPRLQRGANLSQLLGGAKFAFPKLVVLAGNAPASSGYQPGALLLS